MFTRIKYLPFTVSLLVILLCCDSARAQSQKDIVGFVNGVLVDLNMSSIKVPAFESAQAQSAQKTKQANGIGYYLCKLRNKEGPAGYVAVAAEADTYQVIALSATDASPEYFLKQLQVRNLGKQPLRFSRAKLVSFIKDVPLVASANTQLGTEPIEISEIASSLSSLLNHMQYDKKMQLFGHMELFSMDSDYSLPYRNRERPKDWKSLEKELREVKENKRVFQAKSFEERAQLSVEQRNIAKPIIKRRLLNPAIPFERFEALQGERVMIGRVTRTDLSRGMVDAILLQQDYLDTNIANLKRNMEFFFKTRGLTADVRIVPFKNVPTESLPVVLLGPNSIAGVVLGYMDIDNERFVSVFFPKTGKPNIMTRAERDRVIRKAHGLPEKSDLEKEEERLELLKQMRENEARLKKNRRERGIPEPPNEVSADQRFQEIIANMKAADERIVADDYKSKFPGSLKNAVHIIRYTDLMSWQILYINKVQVGDNWGILQSK